MLFETSRSSIVQCGIFAALVVGASVVALAKEAQEGAEPRLDSLFPLSVTRASSIEVELRGKSIDLAYATWCSKSDGVEAILLTAADDDRVVLQVNVDPSAAIGPHGIRLVTPGGVSNELYLHVHEEPVVAERLLDPEVTEESGKGGGAHEKPQAISLPVVVNASITRQGERDLYAFEAAEGAELVFEVLLSRKAVQKGFRPQVTLFDPTGSWFDPQKFTRMNFHTEVLEGATPITSGMFQRFEKAGTYVVEVVSERFKGAPDYAYSLRVVDAARRYRRYGAEPRSTERVFARRLSPDRVAHLWTRAVAPELQSEASEAIKVVAEQEPNNTAGEAMRITAPMLIEGAISQPGDVDRFTFSLDGDHRLAFEIETTGAQPPHFYPRIEIIDSIGRTMLTNVRRVDMPKSQRWDLRALEPKIIQRFEYGGTFSVEVRDVTSRAGGQDFRYRLMIRPQVPHVGDITVSTVKRGYEDARFDPYRVNLAPGEAKTLVVTVPIEEIANEVVEPGGARRFLYGSGELALLVENLPPGVSAYAGSFVENTRDTDMETVKKYYLLPDSELATIILEADRDAPATKSPRGIRVVARTIVDDRPAARVVAGELPLMVVAGTAVTAAAANTSSDKIPETGRPTPETVSVVAADEETADAESDSEGEVATAARPQSDDRNDTAATATDTDVVALAKGDVRSLRIIPERIRLTGEGATQRFLVLALSADGIERDVTAESRVLTSTNSTVVVKTPGVLASVADGKAELTAEYSGRSLTAPVVVTGSSELPSLDFARRVGGVLTRHGCNSGECHGSVKGKGGFKLSINAVFPSNDYAWIVKGGTYHVMKPEKPDPEPVPRINVDDPEESLLLLKATREVSHGGRAPLKREDAGYETLRRWIASGAALNTAAEDGKAGDEPARIDRIEVHPGEIVLESSARHGLVVTAHLSDGTTDDLTSEVRFESDNLEVAEVSEAGRVTGKHAGATHIMVRAAGHTANVQVGVVERVLSDYPEQVSRNFIDEHTFARLRRLQIVPSESSTDGEFLRRVCLDLTGTLPPPSRVREFLTNDDPKKRDQLIDILLSSPEYVEFWTYRFSELFRVYSGATLNVEHARLHEEWIRGNLAQNKPYDQVARERIAAQGYNSPAWHFWTFRELTRATEVTTEQFRVFWGRRLGCAECHDHPFENWSQDQYWGLAAFFGNMTRIAEVSGMRGPYFVIDDPAGHGFRKLGRGKLIHPRTKEPVVPTFLDGTVLPEDKRRDLRARLAEWVTSPENPYFAEAIVNRVWAYFMGRGIVDPVDDFGIENPPTHPELLAALADDFVAHEYDLQHLMRTILQSRTYQLSGEPNETNARDEVNYARALPRLLDPPVLMDVIAQVTGISSELVASGEEDATHGVPASVRAINVLPDDLECTFFDAFNRNDRRGVPEEKPQLTVLRSLHRLVGPTFSGFVGHGGRLDQLLANGASDEDIIEELYLAAATRFPIDSEREQLKRLITEQPSREVGLDSLVWALVNARQFVYNH